MTMAKGLSSAELMILVALVVASLCMADAAADRNTPDKAPRTLIARSNARAHVSSLSLVVDMTGVPAAVTGSTLAFKEKVVDESWTSTYDLVAGKENKLPAIKSELRKAGFVLVQLCIPVLGIDKLVVLDLQQLKAEIVGEQVKAVAVVVVDQEKKLLHLRNRSSRQVHSC